MANKIPLTEPEGGDTLLVTDVNTDIGNWQVASLAVGKDSDNIRDQGLDVWNFDENTVSKMVGRTFHIGDHVDGTLLRRSQPTTFLGLGWQQPQGYSQNASIIVNNFSYTGKYILRCSFRYNTAPKSEDYSFTPSDGTSGSSWQDADYHKWIFAIWYKTTDSAAGSSTWAQLPGTARAVALHGNQLSQFYLDGSLSIACSVNDALSLGSSGTLTSIALELRVHLSTSMSWVVDIPHTPPRHTTTSIPIDVADIQMYVERIKR